ncbi:DUF6867 family protein [Bartonella tamiae]|uniref:DUF6867 domain-containing protein n=1 Tax=Bartonella tamiae Th239 TaxID=1094558 RepID=J1K3R5_9HYPH|nr:hypothetical protein [Bartonella tamiae]EJF91790.1 hypothetical protein ME5_00169 [Bartonella tamiae Th239]EJF92542.1 hypothetical protein MEG_01712 [Bartonella tamiae Th307]
MQGIFYEEPSFLVFVFVTCLLGGWAAWMTGRACALTWRHYCVALIYMIPLACVVRFIHYIPPFNGTLLSVHYYCVDLIVLMIFSSLGFQYTRTKQMVRQYSWLYEKTSALTWRKK